MSTNQKNTANTLSTLSVFSSYIKKILDENYYAKIHSVFPNGFNLNFSGELVYVTYHQAGMMSARGLSIDKAVFAQLKPHLQEGLHVRMRKDQMMVYTRPHVFTIQKTSERVVNLKVIPVTKEELNKFHFKERLEALGLIEVSGFSGNKRLIAILEEILEAREVEVRHIDQLIGAGVGLTPTGDDFLQGMMLMEQTLKHLPVIQNIVVERLRVRSTTDVSLSYYEALFDEYSNEPLVRLFKAVKTQEENSFKEAITDIQNYGETSGFDLLMGILTYLQIL